MGGRLALLGFLVVLVPLGAVLLRGVLTRATPNADLMASTVAARRHAVLGGSLALGAAGGVVLAAMSGAEAVLGPRLFGVPGLLMVLVPGAAGMAHVAVLALTERTWPHPTGRVRAARLAPRGFRNVVPTVLGSVLVVAALVLLGAVVAGALLAAPDGRSIDVQHGVTSAPDGRSIAVQDGPTGAAAGPFPGLTYGLAALASVGVLLIVSVLVLRLVVARPAVEGADELTDEALRRASAHRVLRGALAGTLLTLGPLLAFGGLAAANVHDGAPKAIAVTGAVAGLAAGVAGLVAWFLPAPNVPLPSGATPAPAR